MRITASKFLNHLLSFTCNLLIYTLNAFYVILKAFIIIWLFWKISEGIARKAVKVKDALKRIWQRR